MRTTLRRLQAFVISLLLSTLALLPHGVAAAATQSEALLSRHYTVIQQGQVVKDVLVVGHDALVRGKVPEILVVVDGNLHLTSTAQAGIVVDLGGTFTQDPGAQVEQLFHAAMSTPFWDGTLLGVLGAVLLWASILAIGIAIIILSMLIAVALRHQVATPLAHMEQSVRRVGFIGVFVSLAALAIAALAAVTVVGLPVTVALVIVYLVLGAVGLALTSLWLGKLAMRNSHNELSIWALSLLGSSLLVAFSCIPFIGLLLFAIVWLVGIGTVTSWLMEIWRYRRRPDDV